jgi:hypothetical protein
MLGKHLIRHNVGLQPLQPHVRGCDVRLSPRSFIINIRLSAHLWLLLTSSPIFNLFFTVAYRWPPLLSVVAPSFPSVAYFWTPLPPLVGTLLLEHYHWPPLLPWVGKVSSALHPFWWSYLLYSHWLAHSWLCLPVGLLFTHWFAHSWVFLTAAFLFSC